MAPKCHPRPVSPPLPAGWGDLMDFGGKSLPQKPPVSRGGGRGRQEGWGHPWGHARCHPGPSFTPGQGHPTLGDTEGLDSAVTSGGGMGTGATPSGWLWLCGDRCHTTEVAVVPWGQVPHGESVRGSMGTGATASRYLWSSKCHTLR